MTDKDRRRGTDPLIVEMHGMLSSLITRMDDHIKEDDKAHAKLDLMDQRLFPVEDFHGSMKTAGKVIVVAGTPAVLGIGTALWVWFKNIIVNFHPRVGP